MPVASSTSSRTETPSTRSSNFASPADFGEDRGGVGVPLGQMRSPRFDLVAFVDPQARAERRLEALALACASSIDDHDLACCGS